jgi:hypothetical protein
MMDTFTAVRSARGFMVSVLGGPFSPKWSKVDTGVDRDVSVGTGTSGVTELGSGAENAPVGAVIARVIGRLFDAGPIGGAGSTGCESCDLALARELGVKDLPDERPPLLSKIMCSTGLIPADWELVSSFCSESAPGTGGTFGTVFKVTVGAGLTKERESWVAVDKTGLGRVCVESGMSAMSGRYEEDEEKLGS